MANKQSIPTNHIGGSQILKQTRSVIQQYKAQKEKVDDGEFSDAQVLLNSGGKFLIQRQKVVNENMRLRAAAVLQAEKQQLMNASDIDDFNQIEKASQMMVESEFQDKEGKEFWSECGADIMKAHQHDVAQMKEYKAQEFGKNCLDEMLANSQNMLAISGGQNGKSLLLRAVKSIEETPFLNEQEKHEYRQNYLKSGILNLALNNTQEAHELAKQYFGADDELVVQIDRTAELKEEGMRKINERQNEQEYMGRLRESVSLWQAKERGEINEAAYYVLTAWNKEDLLWGDDDKEEKYPMSEAYRLVKKNSRGEKMSREEMRNAENYLMAAYRQKTIDLETATMWQNLVFEARENGGNSRLKLMQQAADGLADSVLFADVQEEGEEAQKFMEEKAKLSFEIYAAYMAEVGDMVAQATAEGKVLTPTGEHLIMREALKKVAEGYGFEKQDEAEDFAEIRDVAHEHYHGENRAKLWQRFYEKAPYVKDKKSLMIKLASTMEKRNGVSRNAQPFETAEEDGENGDDGKPAPDEKFVDMENARDYAENEYAGTKSDGEREKVSSFNQQKFIDDTMKKDIVEYEGIYQYPYVDTADKITVGPGININNGSRNIEWWYKNPYTKKMRLLDKNNVDDVKIISSELAKLDKYKCGNNYNAKYFEDKTNLRITKKHAHQLYVNRVNAAIEDIRNLIRTHNLNSSKKIENFETMPEPLQIVLVDMVYNLGYERFYWKTKTIQENGTYKNIGYPKFWEALENHDINKMIEEVDRNVYNEKSIRRNEAMKKMLRQVNFERNNA